MNPEQFSSECITTAVKHVVSNYVSESWCGVCLLIDQEYTNFPKV